MMPAAAATPPLPLAAPPTPESRCYLRYRLTPRMPRLRGMQVWQGTLLFAATAIDFRHAAAHA